MKISIRNFALLLAIAAICQGFPTLPPSDDEFIIEEVTEEVVQEEIQTDAQSNPGESESNPAASCKEILDNDPDSSSGNYWVQDKDGNAVQKHCDMTRTCGNLTGGWTRVITLDMRNDNSECPSGLKERQHPDHRLCGMNIDDGGCSSVNFAVDGIQYQHVCGKIIAYQFGATDSFGLHPPNQDKSIDEGYVDGISLTYGQSPRKHVWTFAAAIDEEGGVPYANCPCTHTPTAEDATPSRSFVGNDYFCDTASANKFQLNHFYADDPLWDGAGCGPDNTCCSFNSPPWFYKKLPSNIHDNLEMRVCCNEERSNEDVRIEQIEIYVQ